MSKYSPLTRYLQTQPGSQLPITFQEVEAVVGKSLPPSAYKHRPWWSNNPSNNVMTEAWLEAGWLTSDVDLVSQKLVFKKRPSGPSAGPAPFPARQSSVGTESLTMSNLDKQTIQALGIKALAAGKSISEVAAALITAHARPTMTERLAFADRFRADRSDVHNVDVPSIIRADRDAR